MGAEEVVRKLNLPLKYFPPRRIAYASKVMRKFGRESFAVKLLVIPVLDRLSVEEKKGLLRRLLKMIQERMKEIGLEGIAREYAFRPARKSRYAENKYYTHLNWYVNDDVIGDLLSPLDDLLREHKLVNGENLYKYLITREGLYEISEGRENRKGFITYRIVRKIM